MGHGRWEITCRIDNSRTFGCSNQPRLDRGAVYLNRPSPISHLPSRQVVVAAGTSIDASIASRCFDTTSGRSRSKCRRVRLDDDRVLAILVAEPVRNRLRRVRGRRRRPGALVVLEHAPHPAHVRRRLLVPAGRTASHRPPRTAGRSRGRGTGAGRPRSGTSCSIATRYVCTVSQESSSVAVSPTDRRSASSRSG